jgi:hypothetical protein
MKPHRLDAPRDDRAPGDEKSELLESERKVQRCLLVAVTLASSAVTAANAEQLCTHGGQNPVKGDTEQRAASGAAKMSGASRFHQ